MAEDPPGVEYHCLECKSPNVEAYEFPDEPTVHIYCQAEGCGWMHRGVSIGLFRPGGSQHGKAEVR